jgi:hypothetical protein
MSLYHSCKCVWTNTTLQLQWHKHSTLLHWTLCVCNTQCDAQNVNITQLHLLLCSHLMQHQFKHWFSEDHHRHLIPAPNGYVCNVTIHMSFHSIFQKEINRFINSCPATNCIMVSVVLFKLLVSTYQTKHHHIPQLQRNVNNDPTRPSVFTYSAILGSPASFLSLWLILSRFLLTWKGLWHSSALPVK